MKRKLVVLMVALLVSFNLAVGYRVLTGNATADSNTDYFNLTVFTRALQLVRQDYVDENKTSYRGLTYSALHGMLNSLDPHSQFMEPADFRDMEDETKSEFGGLGIVVSTKDGVITVVTPMEDTPSFRAGIMPGDEILRINGNVTDRMSLQDALSMLKGDPGQKVTLTIYRSSTKETKDFTLQREIIKVTSVKDAKILDQSEGTKFKIGYVRITQFNEPTAQELAQKLDGLQRQGMQALILDLRFNPGGLLTSAVDVCGQFLPPKTMVVYTEGREGSQRHEYFTDQKAKPRLNMPMALLVNGQSARIRSCTGCNPPAMASAAARKRECSGSPRQVNAMVMLRTLSRSISSRPVRISVAIRSRSRHPASIVTCTTGTLRTGST